MRGSRAAIRCLVANRRTVEHTETYPFSAVSGGNPGEPPHGVRRQLCVGRPGNPLVPQMPPFSLTSSDDPGPVLLRIDFSVPRLGTLVVTPAGEADTLTSPDLRRALDQIAEAGRLHVVVDLDQLTLKDASVVDVLVEARERFAEAEGTLRVRCLDPYLRGLLSRMGLEDMLDPIA